MRRLGVVVGVVLLCALAGSVRADDEADCKAVIEKAVKAIGGEANLAKYKGSTWKGKGTFHGMGLEIPYTGTWAIELPDKTAFKIEGDFMGQKFEFASVVTDKGGWRRLLGQETAEMDKEQLAVSREGLQAQYAASLLPLLKDKSYKLSPLGDTKVHDKPVAGVKVSKQGCRDLNLFFDKDTGLLVKSEGRAKDVNSGEEFNQETLYADYKDVGGVKSAMKLTIKRDGQPHVEVLVSDLERFEKMDEALFAKP
jgi:hypothetical protein